MEKNPQQILEELIHRELSKLPERQAPGTLAPRVLAEIQARARKHWWQRPWTRWPASLQLASIPVLFGSAAGAVFGVSTLWNALLARSAFGTVAETFGSVSAIWDVLMVLANAFLMLGRSVGQEWLLLAFLVPLTMYLACIGLGTLCYRTAFYHR